MEEDNNNFCMSCGAPLRDSDTFCTNCGSTRKGAAGSPAQQYNQPPAKKSNTLLFLGIACLLWAAFAIVIGIYYLHSVDSMIDTLMNDYEELFANIGEDYLRSIFVAFGAVFIASGALGAIAGLLCILKRMYIVALITCIIASVLALISVVGIVGFIVAFFIYKNKGGFAGEASS